MLSVLRAAAPVRWIKLKGEHTIMTANDIRNIALLGHGGSGKTSLVEQMLYMTKGIDRLGKTADGNTPPATTTPRRSSARSLSLWPLLPSCIRVRRST